MLNQKLTHHNKWRLWPVHAVAKLFGVLIHVNGVPFGSSRHIQSASKSDGVANDSSVTV